MKTLTTIVLLMALAFCAAASVAREADALAGDDQPGAGARILKGDLCATSIQQ